MCKLSSILFFNKLKVQTVFKKSKSLFTPRQLTKHAPTHFLLTRWFFASLRVQFFLNHNWLKGLNVV